MMMTDTRQLRLLAARALSDPYAQNTVAIWNALVEAEPDIADHWYNLGFVHRAMGSYEAAVEAYSRAIGLNIARPEDAYVNRAVLFHEHLHNPSQAVADLQAALRHRPSYRPALLNLAIIAEDSGDRANALSCYSQLVDGDDDDGRARAGVALMNPDEALAGDQLRHWIAAEPLSSSGRATMLFAHAKLLDRLQEYESAFRAAQEANAIRLATSPKEYGYDANQVETMVDRIIASRFPPAQKAWKEKQPVLICGMFRSGSTLAEHILSAHPDVMGLGELDALPQVIQRHHHIFNDPQNHPDEISQMAEAYSSKVPVTLQNTILDKRPDNIIYVGLFLSMFANAKVIVTHRDILDNLLSVFFLDFDYSVNYSTDLEHSWHWLIQVERLLRHWERYAPYQVAKLNYEALVSNPKAEVKAMLSFLSLEWSDACLEAHKQDRVVRTPSAWSVRKEPFTSSIGKWRNYERQLAPFIDRMNLD
jgi:tetratricopeptide (TPR) repeat protein